MKTIIKENKTDENNSDFYLEVSPFDDEELISKFKFKKRELYELYVQLRDLF